MSALWVSVVQGQNLLVSDEWMSESFLPWIFDMFINTDRLFNLKRGGKAKGGGRGPTHVSRTFKSRNNASGGLKFCVHVLWKFPK